MQKTTGFAFCLDFAESKVRSRLRACMTVPHSMCESAHRGTETEHLKRGIVLAAGRAIPVVPRRPGGNVREARAGNGTLAEPIGHAADFVVSSAHFSITVSKPCNWDS
jgi:hypothetical protein